jgi:hypothetical protein
VQELSDIGQKLGNARLELAQGAQLVESNGVLSRPVNIQDYTNDDVAETCFISIPSSSSKPFKTTS